MLISVNDEQISRVIFGGIYQLPAGATFRGSETVEISASATDVKAVTVVGDLFAESLSAIKSNTQDRIKIDVRTYNGGNNGGKGKQGSKSEYCYGICPYRCMTSILHARRCMAYFPSCGGDYGWCGYGGGGGGRGGYGDVSACLVLDILILVSCLFKLSH